MLYSSEMPAAICNRKGRVAPLYRSALFEDSGGRGLWGAGVGGRGMLERREKKCFVLHNRKWRKGKMALR